jgi:hypothetical protein
MDRAFRSIAKLRKELVPDAEIARVAWSAAVGQRLEAHTRFLELVRDRAVVEVEDAVWQRQLNTLQKQIQQRLEAYLGKGVVRQIEFRVGLPRIAPQRAETGAFELKSQHPEADRIADPGLRRMYLRSKRRATGA